MAIDLISPARADQRGWGPGWPNCQTELWVPLEIMDRRGRIVQFRQHRLVADSRERGGFRFEEIPFPGGVRVEIHELLTLLLLECDLRGYDLMDPGCWGAGCRDIKRPDGTTTGTPSNHSYGLALDINAPANPNQTWTGTLTTDMPPWMPELFNDFGFRWGGHYPRLGGATADAMHYEFCGTPRDAAELTVRARRELGGIDDMTPEQIAKLKDSDLRWEGALAYSERAREDPSAPPPQGKPQAFKQGWKFARDMAQLPKA